MNAALPEDAVMEASGATTLQLLLRSITLQADGINAFEFVHPDGEVLPEVSAGAHVDVHLPGGHVRSYSLASDPSNRSSWTLGVLLEAKGRGGSKALHDGVRVGELVTLGMPRNAFGLDEKAEHSILLAGGIGITPLKSMAHVLAKQGKSFELHYCARSVKNAAFLDALHELLASDRLHLHFDGGDATKSFDIAALLANPKPGQHVYYCGPGGFMKACGDATKHWDAGTVHCEHFKAPENPASAALVAGSFEVRLAKAGISVTVEPNQSIVRAIELAGHRVPTSCLSGLCGACKVEYLEGEVDHQDYILSDEEKTHCLTVCCSRAKSPTLVLDL